MKEKTKIPEPYQEDIRRAIEMLKEAGCADIFLFGSLATGEVHHESDIDLAIRGCPKGYSSYSWVGFCLSWIAPWIWSTSTSKISSHVTWNRKGSYFALHEKVVLPVTFGNEWYSWS